MTERLFVLGLRLLRDRVPDFADYPFNLAAFRTLDELAFTAPVTMFVGENGTGKSTLLEAMAVASGLNAEGGSRNFSFSTRASHSELFRAIRLIRGPHRASDAYFLRAESYFNVASEIERLDAEPRGGRHVIDSYGGRSLHEQSHGEAFFALLLHRFHGESFFILDEPEAALSPTRQLALLARIHQLVAQRCQFVIATHSPIVMAYPGAQLFHLSESGLQPIRYEHTEHSAVTKRFLNEPETMLRELLEGS